MIIGIIGLIFVSVSIILESLDKLPEDHKLFLLLNSIGSLMLAINSYYNEIWIFFILNTLMIIINLFVYLFKIKK